MHDTTTYVQYILVHIVRICVIVHLIIPLCMQLLWYLATCTQAEIELYFHWNLLISYFHFSKFCPRCQHLVQFWSHRQQILSGYFLSGGGRKQVHDWRAGEVGVDVLWLLSFKITFWLLLFSREIDRDFSYRKTNNHYLCSHFLPCNAKHLHCIEYVDLIKRVLPLNNTKHLTDSKCFTDRCFGIETHPWSICWIFSWIEVTINGSAGLLKELSDLDFVSDKLW